MKKNILKSLLISVFAIILIAILFLFLRDSVTKVELPDFSAYKFTELDKLSELVGADIYYNNNSSNLHDSHVIAFNLNFRNQDFDYLDYSYVISNIEESFEQKIDITREGELIYPKKVLLRDATDYKELPSLLEMKKMLLFIHKSNWIDYFGISTRDNVEFNYLGSIENVKSDLDYEHVYLLSDRNIEKLDSLNIEQNKNLWIIRINNEIKYIVF